MDATNKLIQSRMSKQIASDKKIELIGKRLKALDELNFPPISNQ